MSRKQKRTRWTDDMNRDVLACKERAQELLSSGNPSLNINKTTGKKMGYIQLMKQLWEEQGYASLGLTGQNLRDQAARLQKFQILSINSNEIESNITEGREIIEESDETNESRQESNLHTSTIEQVPQDLGNKEKSSCLILMPNLPEFNVFPHGIKEKMWGKLCPARYF